MTKFKEFNENQRKIFNDKISVFTSNEKVESIGKALIDLVLKKQKEMMVLFEALQKKQFELLTKVFDGFKENYLLEEQEGNKVFGVFYDKLE